MGCITEKDFLLNMSEEKNLTVKMNLSIWGGQGGIP